MFTKQCTKCGIAKPLSSFYNCKRAKCGKAGACKECGRGYKAAHREQRRASEAKCTALERDSGIVTERMRRRRAARLEYYRNNREKARSHALVRDAIKAKALTRPSLCPSCGESRLVHAHHDDYSKPLAVRWLCALCHSAVHYNIQTDVALWPK